MRLLYITIAWALLTASSYQRDQIKIVGSSTLYPLVTIAAEHFARKYNYKTPIVESIGTGAGMKLFCGGNDIKYPDIANASRKIKATESDLCEKNQVKNFDEIILGFDGVIIARSVKGVDFALNSKSLFLALAKYIIFDDKMVENPYDYWDEIDPDFDHIKIEVFGPAYGSGTRDVLTDLVAEQCLKQSKMTELYPNLADRKIFCSWIREDGRYVESGENDNIIISKIIQNPKALGVISFNYLRSNSLKINAIALDGAFPTVKTIISGKYKLSRPLYLYFNKEHYKTVAHLEDFVREIQTKGYIGPDGILTKNGLISK